MKTKIINLYEFDELSESAKENAVRELWDCNIDFSDWHESVTEDASRVGVVITEWDLNHHSMSAKISDCEFTANEILKEHGEQCDTHKLAKKFLADRDALIRKYSDADSQDVVAEGNELEFDNDLDYLEDDFISELKEEYLSMLRKEYEYLTSEATIIETIKSNCWTFTAEGKLQN
jgi:hypothetical protein